MSIFLAALMVAFGLFLLCKGADWLIEAASGLAHKIGVSPLIIGLTIVAFGTSLPELIVSVLAAISGNGEIAFGNVLGSNIANVFLILGLAASIKALSIKQSTINFEMPLAIMAAILMMMMAKDQVISFANGLVFLLGFGVFFIYIILSSINQAKKTQQLSIKPLKKHNNVFLILGLVALAFGGKLTVEGASQIASALGLTQELIGLTIVAVGTSLPELVTSIVGVIKGETDLVIGNIVGSNLFNTFWILGVTSMIMPIEISGRLSFDLWLNIGTFILILVFTYINKTKFLINRWQGGLLFSCYIFYLVIILGRELSWFW